MVSGSADPHSVAIHPGFIKCSQPRWPPRKRRCRAVEEERKQRHWDSPIMDQALRGQHWSIEEPRRGFWMWTTTCTPILSTFKFNRHQKKRRRKKKISPNLFERNDKIYCCRPLGDLFSSLRCVKCVLAFFLSSVLLFKCMDGERHPPKLQS